MSKETVMEKIARIQKGMIERKQSGLDSHPTSPEERKPLEMVKDITPEGEVVEKPFYGPPVTTNKPNTFDEFEDEFELKLLAFSIRDVQFYLRNLPVMRFDYFTSPFCRDVYEISDKYIEEYAEAIPRDIMRNEIQKMFKERQKKDAKIDSYFDFIDRLLDMDLSGEKYTQDEVNRFAQRQSMKKASHDLMMGIIEHQNLEPLVTNINKALVVGQTNEDEGGSGMCEILEKKVEEPEYLIKPFMKPGEKGYLTAGYKVGKTFMELQLTYCLSKGIPFLGFEVPKPRKVLYIRFELTEYEFSRRLKQMSKWEWKETIKSPAWFIPWKGFDLTAKGEKDLQKLFRQIDKHEPDLLIFDPLYKLTGLNLADPKSAAPLLGAFVKVQKKFPNLSINSAHHMVKLSGDRSGDSWDSSYGPMQFFADMDYEMRLRKIANDGSEPRRFKLDFLTNSTPVDKMELERDEDTLIYKVVTESKLQKKVHKDQKDLGVMDGILKKEGKISKTTFQKLCQDEGVGRHVFEHLIPTGEKDLGWVVTKVKNRVFYEPKGFCFVEINKTSYQQNPTP